LGTAREKGSLNGQAERDVQGGKVPRRESVPSAKGTQLNRHKEKHRGGLPNGTWERRGKHQGGNEKKKLSCEDHYLAAGKREGSRSGLKNRVAKEGNFGEMRVGVPRARVPLVLEKAKEVEGIYGDPAKERRCLHKMGHRFVNFLEQREKDLPQRNEGQCINREGLKVAVSH